MSEEQIKTILAQLADHEARLKSLESGTPSAAVPVVTGIGDKQKTLREIVRGKKLKNGPEKIAVIIGYHEKIVGKLINKDDIRKDWTEAKFDGTYKTNLMDDASGTYVRVHSNGECDLTQTGEDFFDQFIKNEPVNATSK